MARRILRRTRCLLRLKELDRLIRTAHLSHIEEQHNGILIQEQDSRDGSLSQLLFKGFAQRHIRAHGCQQERIRRKKRGKPQRILLDIKRRKHGIKILRNSIPLDRHSDKVHRLGNTFIRDSIPGHILIHIRHLGDDVKDTLHRHGIAYHRSGSIRIQLPETVLERYLSLRKDLRQHDKVVGIHSVRFIQQPEHRLIQQQRQHIQPQQFV